MSFGSEPRRDLFRWQIRESLYKPDPTTYNLAGAISPERQKKTSINSPDILTDLIRSISPPSFGHTTFGVSRTAWDKVVS